jgi:hypothetical protein
MPSQIPEGLRAIALTCKPSAKPDIPCLVLEGVADAAEALNAVASACDELSETVNRLASLAWEEHGLDAIVTELTALLGNPVYTVDSGFKVMAIAHEPDMEEASLNWSHAAKYGYLSYDTVAGLIQSNELREIESHESTTMINSNFFAVPFANFNLRHGGKVEGHLFVVQMYKMITPGEIELIDLAAPHVLHAMLANPAFQARSGSVYEHFVTDWLDGTITDAIYIRSQLRALALDPDAFVAVAVLWPETADETQRSRLAWLLEDRHECRAVTRDGHIVALFQLAHQSEKAALIRKLRSICRNQKCEGTLSDVQEGMTSAPIAYRQALEARRISASVGADGEVTCYADVAAYQPYLNFSTVEELDAFCHPAIVSLRDYDKTHAVQLLPTLSAFLKNDRDVQVTASELFIHRNTLTYRINKILEMCPVDLDDFTTRHRLLESIIIVENYEGITSHLPSLAEQQ